MKGWSIVDNWRAGFRHARDRGLRRTDAPMQLRAVTLFRMDSCLSRERRSPHGLRRFLYCSPAGPAVGPRRATGSPVFPGVDGAGVATGVAGNETAPQRRKPLQGLNLLLVGTAGFEFNGPHAEPLLYRHLRAPHDRIGSYRLLWTGKHYGKRDSSCSDSFVCMSCGFANWVHNGE